MLIKRLPKLERLDKKEKNVFYTTPDVSVYTAARKKRVVYEDSAGLCLKADKNLAETIRLSIYLLLALRKQTGTLKEPGKAIARTGRN